MSSDDNHQLKRAQPPGAAWIACLDRLSVFGTHDGREESLMGDLGFKPGFGVMRHRNASLSQPADNPADR